MRVKLIHGSRSFYHDNLRTVQRPSRRRCRSLVLYRDRVSTFHLHESDTWHWLTRDNGMMQVSRIRSCTGSHGLTSRESLAITQSFMTTVPSAVMRKNTSEHNASQNTTHRSNVEIAEHSKTSHNNRACMPDQSRARVNSRVLAVPLARLTEALYCFDSPA